jgi:hypothetical protein
MTQTNMPTMARFSWSARELPPATPGVLGDFWCVRDSYCALMGWAPGSDEWARFIEAPIPDDMDRLTDHLGLVWFDPLDEEVREELLSSLDHPGVACYNFFGMRMSHVQYQPNLRRLRPLPVEYTIVDPNWELFRFVIDIRQAPHVA